MFLHVDQAQYLEGYKVKVLFNNGREGIADLGPALKGEMFDLLKDPVHFSKLKVDDELETIAWPNGADLAPEYIYFQAFKDDPELREQFINWGYIS